MQKEILNAANYYCKSANSKLRKCPSPNPKITNTPNKKGNARINLNRFLRNIRIDDKLTFISIEILFNIAYLCIPFEHRDKNCDHENRS